MWHVVLFAAAVTAVPSPTVTPPPPPVIVPRDNPPRELAELAAFEGTWECESLAVEGRPAARLQMTVQKDLGGFWYSGRVVPRRAEGEPAARLFFWSHDAVVGKFVGGWLDNQGGWSAQ